MEKNSRDSSFQDEDEKSDFINELDFNRIKLVGTNISELDEKMYKSFQKQYKHSAEDKEQQFLDQKRKRIKQRIDMVSNDNEKRVYNSNATKQRITLQKSGAKRKIEENNTFSMKKLSGMSLILYKTGKKGNSKDEIL